MPSFQNESRLQGKIKMIPFKLKWKYHRSYIINFAFFYAFVVIASQNEQRNKR